MKKIKLFLILLAFIGLSVNGAFAQTYYDGRLTFMAEIPDNPQYRSEEAVEFNGWWDGEVGGTECTVTFPDHALQCSGNRGFLSGRITKHVNEYSLGVCKNGQLVAYLVAPGTQEYMVNLYFDYGLPIFKVFIHMPIIGDLDAVSALQLGTLLKDFGPYGYHYTDAASVTHYTGYDIAADDYTLKFRIITVDDELFESIHYPITYAYENDYAGMWASPNTDATLATLIISEGELTPEFNSETENYTVDVAYSIEEITITATATDENATVSGDTGTFPLETGDNEFTITVTAEDGTTSKTYTVTVNRAEDVGIAWTNGNSPLRVYPNPTTGQLTINNGELRIEDVAIYDMLGRNVHTSSVTCHSSLVTLDISHLPSGIYFLRVGNETVKVVKQ